LFDFDLEFGQVCLVVEILVVESVIIYMINGSERKILCGIHDVVGLIGNANQAEEGVLVLLPSGRPILMTSRYS
jgi:hypothetical protein